MTTNVLPRLTARIFVPVVLVVSAGYVFVYLYRWEWNRALISGLFFLVAEVAYVGSSLHREIRVLSERTTALETAARDRLHSRLGETDVRPARPFGWLRDNLTSGTNVFVPVLLGAGVIFSAAAFVVERMSGAVARSTVDRRTVRHLAGLEPLPHGLLDERGGAGRDEPRRYSRWLDIAGRAGTAAVLVVLLGAAVDLLADATQSRPTPVQDGTSTIVELEIGQRRSRPVLHAAEALAVACRSSLRSGTEITHITRLDDDHVELVVEPGLGEPRRRRLFGCLEDTTLDLIQADVTGWTEQPAPAGS